MRKSWTNIFLKYPKKAFIVIDDNKAQASAHAGQIIKHYSCQAASVSNETELQEILIKARKEDCEIVGVITDQAMETTGTELIYNFRKGKYNAFYHDNTTTEKPIPRFLLITGDAQLGADGLSDISVLPKAAWRKTRNKDSAIGAFIRSALGDTPSEKEMQKAEQETSGLRDDARQASELINLYNGADPYGYHANDSSHLKMLKKQAIKEEGRGGSHRR
jgi:hypothetical protein